jgi:hypothetical protein
MTEKLKVEDQPPYSKTKKAKYEGYVRSGWNKTLNNLKGITQRKRKPKN